MLKQTLAVLTLLGVLALRRDGFTARPQQPTRCDFGLRRGDTARFAGVMTPGGYWFASDPHPEGNAAMWLDSTGRVHYSESWRLDTNSYVWAGELETDSAAVPRRFRVTRLLNGKELADEKTEERLPRVRPALLRVLIAQCVLTRRNRPFALGAAGGLRVQPVQTITLSQSGQPRRATLYVLMTDSLGQFAGFWLDSATHQLLSFRQAEGVMDLVARGMEAVTDTIGRAEGVAARVPGAPVTCAGGSGVGGCEVEQALNDVCKAKVKSLRPPAGRSGGTFTLSDSGYSISSDGRGPYRSGSANVRVSAGGVGNPIVFRENGAGGQRTFFIDLGHPVTGDVGQSHGRVEASAQLQRPFVPAGTNYSLEITFLWMSSDTTQFTGDIPVGVTVPGSLFINFYLDGLLYVIVAGPAGQHAEICSTYGSALYYDGTTVPTISHPTATSWVIDLPPGSVARLFDSHNEERHAMNRGLYYLSLHGVIRQ